MARLGRLGGGLLLETTVGNHAAWFLIGDTKVPCDWSAAGFSPPPERDVIHERFIQLEVRGAPTLTGTTLRIELEGLEAARAIAERLIVSRNGSVSERLWTLILGEEEIEEATQRVVPCDWLCEMPTAVWDVVRAAVLKCT